MTDPERVELNELCSALVDGTITESQRERLQDLLRQGEEARRFYVRAMQLSASLHGYAAEMQSEAAEQKIIRPAQWQRWLWPMAAAAIVMLAVWLPRPTPPPPVPHELAELVAMVTGGKDCQWEGGTFANGDEVAAGQELELKAGLAELTFDSGAQLVMQAPARLSVRSAWEAELKRGTVKANVPQEAIGFRVVNAAVEVVDLGTEFGVTAHEDGAAEVFVLKGAVEVHSRDAAGQRQGKSVLREKQAKRFAKAGQDDVRDREAKFAKLMQKVAIDRLSKPLKYARWSFDEGSGGVANVSEPNGGALPVAAGPGTRWVPGRFGKALEFDGTFATQAGLMGPLRRGIRSVAFWVQTPPSGPNAETFLAFPGPRIWGPALELGWNRTSAEGVFGAVRFDSPMGSLVGSTPLRDGRWHHVAVVLGAPPKVTGKPPLKFYVDGRLENFSGKNPFRRSARMAEGALLWLAGAPGGGDHFVGALDELVLVDLPLTPQEIRHLMQTNTLLSPAAIAQFGAVEVVQ